MTANGLKPLTDGEREADIDNPRGYYEWERIKSLPRDPSCIDEAEGKAVKVISQLLFALPPGRDYRIIFMERPFQEVVASQAEMIRRRGTSGAGIGAEALTAALQAHLNQVSAWLKDHPFPVFRIAYHQVIRDPRGISEKLQAFLGCPMDLEKMTEQVQTSLYRQHSA